MSWFVKLCGVVAFALMLAAVGAAQEIRIAAASDLTAALPALVQSFEHEHHCTLAVSFGSSGNFYQQLQNGAPFDVFLSADMQYPQALQDAGLTVPGTLAEYATGKLVLWVRNDSHLDFSKGLRALLDPSVKKVAMANPRHAPYGKAAEAALKAEGLYDQLSSRIVLGENVSQAATFSQTGNADAGLLPLSLALNPTMKSAGRFVEIPATEYPPIRQAAVVMKNSKNPELARKFVESLSSPLGRQVLEQFGFSTQ